MSKPVHFIYIHGFNSSPQSVKAQLLIKAFAARGIGHQLSVPELSHWPNEAMEQLRGLVERQDNTLLIGSSLGGFYATWLTEHSRGARAVLINPAVAPHRLLTALLGETQNYYTGHRYELTEQHLVQLEALYQPRLQHPERLLLMQQEGDETLDYRDAVRYYAECEQIVQPGGNHGFEHFDRMIPTLFEFADRTAL